MSFLVLTLCSVISLLIIFLGTIWFYLKLEFVKCEVNLNSVKNKYDFIIGKFLLEKRFSHSDKLENIIFKLLQLVLAQLDLYWRINLVLSRIFQCF